MSIKEKDLQESKETPEETLKEFSINVNIMAGCYSAAERYLQAIVNNYKKEEKRELNRAIKKLTGIRTNIYSMLRANKDESVSDKIDDFYENVAEIQLLLDDSIKSYMVKACYCICLVNRFHAKADFAFLHPNRNNYINKSITIAHDRLNKVFEKHIEEKDLFIDFEVFESKLISFYK